MTLIDTQQMFAVYVCRLIQQAITMGYRVRLGEAWRSPEEAARQAKTGAGIPNSLHTQRLAIDLLLDKDGQYLTKTEDYTPLGQWWKTQHPLARWGGDFPHRPDGNHFSFTWGGVS